MTGWILPFATGAMLALTACATAPQRWQESGGAGHSLVGQIYRVADATQVDESI